MRRRMIPLTAFALFFLGLHPAQAQAVYQTSDVAPRPRERQVVRALEALGASFSVDKDGRAVGAFFPEREFPADTLARLKVCSKLANLFFGKTPVTRAFLSPLAEMP